MSFQTKRKYKKDTGHSESEKRPFLKVKKKLVLYPVKFITSKLNSSRGGIYGDRAHEIGVPDLRAAPEFYTFIRFHSQVFTEEKTTKFQPALNLQLYENLLNLNVTSTPLELKQSLKNHVLYKMLSQFLSFRSRHFFKSN